MRKIFFTSLCGACLTSGTVRAVTHQSASMGRNAAFYGSNPRRVRRRGIARAAGWVRGAIALVWELAVGGGGAGGA